MRIAMVAACPFPSRQGSQVFVRQMCEALARRGHEIELLTYGQSELDVSTRGYVHRRIPRLPGDDALRSGPTWTKLVLDARLALELRRMLARGEFDVVHCHNYEAAAVGALARLLRRVPTVYHSHGLLEAELPTYLVGRAARSSARMLGKAFDSLAPRTVDHTVVLTENDRAQLRSRGVAAECVSVLAPALDDPGEPPDRTQARAAFGLENGVFTIGYAGNLDTYQSLETLSEAVVRLAASGSTPRPFWLVLTHERDSRFDAMLERTGARDFTRVIELSSFTELHRASAACDALVLPRQVRCGLPIKLLNYLAMGGVVIAASGGFDLITHEQDGLVVDGDGAEPIARALARMAVDVDLARRLRVGAREKFVKDLTWATAAPALESVYAEATGAWRAAQAARAMIR